LEQHWNGAKLATAETMLEWAKNYGLERDTAGGQPLQNGLPERDFSDQSNDADD
jgi:hypothetical protein